MDREQAAEALAVLRSVVAQTRDDTALQNWGVIWIVHGMIETGGNRTGRLQFSEGRGAAAIPPIGGSERARPA